MRITLPSGDRFHVDRFATFAAASHFARLADKRLVRGDDECIWAVEPADLKKFTAVGYQEVAL